MDNVYVLVSPSGGVWLALPIRRLYTAGSSGRTSRRTLLDSTENTGTSRGTVAALNTTSPWTFPSGLNFCKPGTMSYSSNEKLYASFEAWLP